MTPLRRQTFSVQVAVADASGWLRDKATNSSTNMSTSLGSLNFYKAVRLFWKRNRDALISWILMAHHETARPCCPSVATFFRQVTSNMNCEASSAATNATSVAYGSVAFAVLNREVKIIRSMKHEASEIYLFICWKCSKCGFKKCLERFVQ